MVKNLLLIIFFFSSCKLFKEARQTEKAKTQEILEYQLEKVDTLVDIGCGQGDFTRDIAHVYPNLFFKLEDLPFLIGYKNRKDTSRTIQYNTKNQIEFTLKNSPYAKRIESRYLVIIGTQDSIPMPANSAQRILCRKTLHEFKSANKMALELERILSKNGILTIVEPNPQYTGHIDVYCKSKYITKDEIKSIFKSLKLVSESSIIYPDGTMNILNFSK
ncbi:MAG: methyltransferase domain-containing protein [Chitinophagaceae bacterium]|jgi:ubiquinone/menaquinone biosynthesis C-methylase UbiE|nr:methyltransferase domain-containing protein [Chitinophagaceae bacterium]